ncbi:hotdog family protein [Falsigemmobacter faecalis]|nr:hypothetical protein [Falsigemmobacter faecalis]
MSLPASGTALSFRKTLTVADQGFFTGISGNLGALYVDRLKAQALGQPDMVVFELAAGALFTTALNRIAGPQWRIAGFALDFAKPLALNTSFEARAEVEGSSPDALTFVLTGLVGTETVATGSARLVPVQG